MGVLFSHGRGLFRPTPPPGACPLPPGGAVAGCFLLSQGSVEEDASPLGTDPAGTASTGVPGAECFSQGKISSPPLTGGVPGLEAGLSQGKPAEEPSAWMNLLGMSSSAKRLSAVSELRRCGVPGAVPPPPPLG